MVIILITADNTMDVLIDVFDDQNSRPDMNISSFFHKKIHGAISPCDGRSIQKIASAREEILELIY
jgi:hypothetical protein